MVGGTVDSAICVAHPERKKAALAIPVVRHGQRGQSAESTNWATENQRAKEPSIGKAA
jgi:hypothetical protein